MNIKNMSPLTKFSAIVGIMVGVVGVMTALFAIERPVMYNREFLPVASDVADLVAQNTHTRWAEADEQVERRKARVRRLGDARTPEAEEERRKLRLWKATLFELERKLDKLKPKK